MDLDSSTNQSKKRSLDEDSHDEVDNKGIKIELLPLNPMIFNPVFPHIVQKIFDQLDRGSLRSCREVSRSWLESVDNQNLLWKEIVKDEGCDKVFQFACKNGHIKMLEMLFQKPTRSNIDYNAKGPRGWTAFHFCCLNGHLKIVEMIIRRSQELNIELNAKDDIGWTAFHFACQYGHLKIVEMIITKSQEFNIDLNAKDDRASVWSN